MLKHFGFEDVRMLQDPTYDEVKRAIHDLMMDIHVNKNRENSNTLSFVYFAGHGIIDNAGQSHQTEMLLNVAGLVTYPLEKALSTLATAPGSYVVSVLDCCRESIEKPKKVTRGTLFAKQDSFEE